MRISARGRYALAATVHMAHEYNSGQCITIISMSETLGISKIYLEQVFSLLKRGDIVNSIKGAQGGYILARPPKDITVLDVLTTVENSMFEATENTVDKMKPQIDAAMRSLVFDELDTAVRTSLAKTSLDDILLEVEKYDDGQGHMYYI